VIPLPQYLKHYGVGALQHHAEFGTFVEKRIAEAIDPETTVTGLRIESSWKDAGGNRHGAVRAHGKRRDEHGDLGADIVWLIRSKTFRGSFWSQIPKRTDSDYYSQARTAFYRRDYDEFLRLADFPGSSHSSTPAFRKMLGIATRLKYNKANKTSLPTGNGSTISTPTALP
jgi:hypothetical protein